MQIIVSFFNRPVYYLMHVHISAAAYVSKCSATYISVVLVQCTRFEKQHIHLLHYTVFRKERRHFLEKEDGQNRPILSKKKKEQNVRCIETGDIYKYS